MTSPKRSSKGKEDNLPKVIICGKTEQNIPKLLLCDDKNKKIKSYPQSCNQEGNVRPSTAPKFSKRPREVPTRYNRPNSGLDDVRNKLQFQLHTKEQTIEDLQRKLCSVQCEMEMLIRENSMLNNRIQQACDQDLVQVPCGKNYAQIENRLYEYSENTKQLERQLANMESNVKSMKNELSVVQAERSHLEKHQKVLFYPPTPPCFGHGPCGSRPSTCGQRPPSCEFRPHQCSLRRTSSDQHLLDLKDQYCKLQDNFRKETHMLVKKISKNLDSRVK